jgi:NADPH:quinone reductase-like Zn-dependent oxidoreductase
MTQAVKGAEKVAAYHLLEKLSLDGLKLSQDEPAPMPWGHVRVKMHAASLNYRDLMVVKGLYNPRLKEPEGTVPLSDGAGEIIEVAEGVSRFKVGDKVLGCFMQKWIGGGSDAEKAKSALGAGSVQGVLAKERVFNQEGLVHMPAHLSYEEGATLPCAAVTAWYGLVVSGEVKPGDTVLLQGTGGVSIFALQFAKLAGATVIITSSSDQKLKSAQKLGADHLINYKTNPDWEKEAIKFTGGRGVDHVIEVGGAGTLAKSLQAARIGGHVALIGVLTQGDGNFDPRPLLMKNIKLQGIYVGSRDYFEAMNAAITANKLKPVVDRVFPFEKAKEAYEYLESGAHFGKIVIRIS